MGIKSVEFAYFAFVAIGLFHLLPGRFRSNLLFPAATGVFLWLQMPEIGRITVLLLFCLATWLLIRIALLHRSPSVLLASILLTVAIYYFARSSSWLAHAAGYDGLMIVGIAYILIRSLQVLVDTWEDPRIAPNLPAFLGFLLAWPTLISGPIQRWQEFNQQRTSLEAFRLNREVLTYALGRIARGYFFVFVLGDIARRVWTVLVPIALQDASPIALGGAQVVYFIYLTFDFIGYTDIVIGLASLCGFRLPENFDRPWLATSYLDFWSRWHMTLSGFFKTYVFNPVMRTLTYSHPGRHLAVVHAIAAFFATFFLVGLWHGVTWHFVVCGLLLAIGATFNQLFRIARGKRGKGRRRRRLPILVTNSLSGTLTLTYLCFSIMPLWLTSLTWNEAVNVFGNSYGISGLSIASIATFVALLPIVVLAHGAVAIALHWKLARITWLSPIAAGAAIAGIHVYAVMFPSSATNFVYQAF